MPNLPPPTRLLPPTRLPPVVDASVSMAEQDADGTVWAIQEMNGSALWRWDGKSWKIADYAPTDQNNLPSSYTRSLAKAPNGSVLCLWINSETAYLSAHRGNQSRLVATWHAGPARNPQQPHWQILATAHRVWIVGEFRHIFRLDEHDHVLPAYTIDDRQLFHYSSDTAGAGQNDLRAVDDSQGRTWFMTSALTHGPDDWSLRGAVVYDGTHWVYHSHFSGLPDYPVNTMANVGAGHLWLGLYNGGLYDLDTRTLLTFRMAEPQAHCFDRVHLITEREGIRYVLADTVPVRYPDCDDSLRNGDIWRWNRAAAGGPGEFKRVLNGLDRGGDLDSLPNRPILTTPSGMWVGALCGGVWFVPRGSGVNASFDWPKARRITWRNRFPLAQVQAIFAQTGAGPMAMDLRYTGHCALDIEAYRGIPTSTEIDTFTVHMGPVVDVHHHIWCVKSLHENTLDEWNGSRWIRHALPSGIMLVHLQSICIDARDRLWLLPDLSDSATAVLDLKTNGWQVYSGFGAAMLAQLRRFGSRGLEGLGIHGIDNLVPRTSLDGRICFLSAGGKLCYYEGARWRRWAPKDCAGKFRWGVVFFGAPFFDAKGRLTTGIAIDGPVAQRQWTSTGWSVVSDIPDPRDAKPLSATAITMSQVMAMPTGPDNWEPDSSLQDNDGMTWMVHNHQLYKSAFGLRLPQFAADTVQPFLNGAYVGQVIPDSAGRYLVCAGDESEYFFLPDHGPPPATRIEMKTRGVDSVTLHFNTEAAKPHWFRWRQDGGAWTGPTTVDTIALDDLPAGRHRFEAMTIDAWLQIEPHPAVATFLVNIDKSTQIAGWIDTLLNGAGDQRDRAEKALVRLSKEALPALKSSRERATDEQKWWIDAAIQEIESKN